MSERFTTILGNPMMLGVTKTEYGYNFATVAQDTEVSLNLYHKGKADPFVKLIMDESYRFGDVFAVEVRGLDFSNVEYNYQLGDRFVLDPYAKQVCEVYAFGEALHNQEQLASQAFTYVTDPLLGVTRAEQLYPAKNLGVTDASGMDATGASDAGTNRAGATATGATVTGQTITGANVTKDENDKKITHMEKVYHYRSKVASEEFDWEGDHPIAIPYEDTILYKLHVRGFTKHSSSKVAHRGTYRGIIEKIPYLLELGINSVELMPVFEFEEVQKWTLNSKNSYYNPQFNGRTNYWGYTPGMYFAPKAAYASNSSKNQDYTVEFKEMVKALHRAGIEVIVEMYFPSGSSVSLISDCVRHWVVEYHIDGVHIDVCDAAKEALSKDPLLSRIKILTTYWNVNEKNRSYRNLANYNTGFSNCARKLLKGDENQLSEFVTRMKENSTQVATINYITNNNGFTLQDLVSYDRKHNEANGENNNDGEDFNNSWNCGVEGKTRKKKILELRRRQQKNALLMVFLSQGTPLLLAGDEFGNSKSGNNNSYCQDNEVSWLNWKELEKNRDLFEFTKQLIEFRKNHRILHMPTALRDMDYCGLGYPDISYHGEHAWFGDFATYQRQLGVLYCGAYGTMLEKKNSATLEEMETGSKVESEDSMIYVAYNLHWEVHTLALPKLPDGRRWRIYMETGVVDGGMSKSQGESAFYPDSEILVGPRSITVLISETVEVPKKKKTVQGVKKKHESIKSISKDR
ncbi:MAG: alpha-amylase [Lachnospiraceae bacterium]|nr:alpha-amylase [Lachnospiraceae bacterium]